VKEFTIIDATDPVVVPRIVHKELLVGGGLWWDRGLPFKPYRSSIADSYGVSYPSWNLTTGEPVYIVASKGGLSVPPTSTYAPIPLMDEIARA